MTRIGDIFEMRVAEKIDPVIKVGDTGDEGRLASEIGSYVVTQSIEKYIDEFLDHYTDTFRKQTEEIGVWISGYFGSGKSHLAKIVALLVADRMLVGTTATKRFEGRIPSDAQRRASISRELAIVPRCSTQVLAFNLNTLADSRSTPLAKLLLGQYYQSRGYCSNVLLARVIEQEMDRLGRLAAFREQASAAVKRPWDDIRSNTGFYTKLLYDAACKVAPEVFATRDDVDKALRNAESGDLVNIQFLVRTIVDDLAKREAAERKPQRMMLVLDESGQWIEADGHRLAQLQALVEEAALQGQGRIWIVVTTHEDMGAIYAGAQALRPDMKKIEGRFRFKWSLTTENIEQVLENRLLRKGVAGRDAVGRAFDEAPGAIRGLGELANVDGRRLPACDRERFVATYPFLPYQVYLVPDILKGLRSKGGRGEQLSGSTRTLLAITQDILRVGRRPYLDRPVGDLVSFDEVYGNICDSEVAPEVRRELQRIEEVVPGATERTRRVAEVLFMLREVPYVPRTPENLARLLAQTTSDDLPALAAAVRGELDLLQKARLVARIGEESEFLTGERRTFEDEVGTVAAELKTPELEAGLTRFFVYDTQAKANNLRGIMGFERVPYKGGEFEFKASMDGVMAFRDGHVEVRIESPLRVMLHGTKIDELVNRSLLPDEARTVFVLCERVSGFDQDLRRFLAMREVVAKWKGDVHKSDESRRLADERESGDLRRLEKRISDALKESLRNAWTAFRGTSRAMTARPGQPAGDGLRAELVQHWPSVFPHFEKVPVRIVQEQRAVMDVLAGRTDLSADVRTLRLYEAGGAVNQAAPVIDAIRVFLAARQARKDRTYGRDLLAAHEAPPFGWDPNAVRVGVAACVRAGIVRLVVAKVPRTNPADDELQRALRDSREFDRAEIQLEEVSLDPQMLEDVRKLLLRISGRGKIDETPAALHEVMGEFGTIRNDQAHAIAKWAEDARFPLPGAFAEARDAFESVLALTNPVHRIREIHVRRDPLAVGSKVIQGLHDFHERLRPVFAELRDLAASISAMEYRLPVDGGARRFLAEWTAAVERANVSDTEVWKTLQARGREAEVEIRAQVTAWRDEARTKVARAVENLPVLLSQLGLPADAGMTARASLNEFLARVDTETDAARVASLPDRANALTESVAADLRREADRRRPPPPPGRGVKRVRMADIAPSRRVTSFPEWGNVRDAIDERMRELLDGTTDVELE